ncbi:DUF1828 domain-containing protein [Gluconacetobacter aggeris]|uniref:DUF1828 domain-containing protein n=1 Tax=Gluconacetobacter aggeris TaxID=1286186 RepID=A0A7W4IQP5_9PROT|nr:DUF1828 domain-containing protein [Gluconacetobacter aggeris]MBB2167274.1 DUF1828 domain-containing protein [Gluconacetobacter aggeris]
MNAEHLKEKLCAAFCSELSVNPVPAGLAFSGIFEDLNGDRVTGYLVRDRGAPYLSDDGSFLSDLESSGIDISEGTRAQFMQGVLASAGAFIDPETLSIRTHSTDREPTPDQIVLFMSALVRAQDVSFWSRERVKSTFSEDLMIALVNRFGNEAKFIRQGILGEEFSDFPSDILLKPINKGIPVAMFLAQTTERLTEAMTLSQEMRIRHFRSAKILALTENGENLSLASRKVSRAVNRIDGLLVYRHDEDAALDRIGRLAELPIAA